MLKIKIKPPTHRIDGGGIAISFADCWDWDRVQKELDELELQALQAAVDKALEGKELSEEEAKAVKASVVLSEDEKDAAKNRHPVRRYLRGETRLQPDAPDWDAQGKQVTARDYLLATPTEFIVRRLGWADHQRCSEISNTRQRLIAFLRAGLIEIRSEDFNWKRKDGEEIQDDLLQSIHEAGNQLLTEIGSQVVAYNRPLDESEGKR